MFSLKKISGNSAMVGQGARSGGSVFSHVRKPDGSIVTVLDRQTYESALSSAKAVLRKHDVSPR
jgi:hypothetical protein